MLYPELLFVNSTLILPYYTLKTYSHPFTLTLPYSTI